MISERPDRPQPSTRSNERLVRNISLLTASQLITWVLAAVWTVFVPRLLGPAGMGLLVMAWALSAIVGNLCSLGLPTLLVKEIAGAPHRAPRLLGTAVIVRAVCCIPCLALTLIYVRLGHFEGDKALVLYLAAAIAIGWLFLDLQMAAFQGIERMEYLAYGNILNKGVFTVGSIALVLAGFHAIWLVTVLLAATIVDLVLFAIWSRRYFHIDWRTDLVQIRRLFYDSLPYWGFVVFLSFYQWIDSAMLAVMTPPAVVGWYGLPTRIFGSMLVIPVILYTAWLPKLVNAYKVSDEELRRIARVPIEVVTSLSLPIGIGAALVAGPVIMGLYGPAYAPSIPVFAVLALTAIPMYANITISQVLIASNRQGTWMRVLAAASLVNPAVNFFLIQIFQQRLNNGALGAALSLLVTELLMAVCGTIAIRKMLYRESLARLTRVALATAGLSAVVVATSRFGLLVEILAGGLSFVLFALLLRVLSREQLADALSLATNRLHPRARRATPVALLSVEPHAES